jgi:hypothetical protein
MRVLNSFLQFSCFVIDPKAAINESHCKCITRAFGIGDPVMVSGVSIKIQKFVSLGVYGIPSVHDIIITDT